MVNNSNALTPGAVVTVRSGKYVGCRLTYVGCAAGWHVCLNSYEVGGFVRVRRIEFVRPADVFDAERHDRVFYDDMLRRIEFAQRMTGCEAGR